MWTLLAFLIVSICALLTSELAEGCRQDDICGFNSHCKNGTCICKNGFHSINVDGKNCVDGKCGHGHCYKCHDSKRCKRCKEIVIEGTGECVKECSTRTSLVISGEYEGTVCAAPKDKSVSTVYIAIITGICGLMLILIVLGIIYCRHRHRQRDERIEGGFPGASNGIIPLGHSTDQAQTCDAKI